MKKLLFSLALIPLICSGEETNKLLSAQETTNAIIALSGSTGNPTFGTVTVTNGIVFYGTNGSRLGLVNDLGQTNVWYDGTNLYGAIIVSNATGGNATWSITYTNLQTSNNTPVAVWTNTIPTNNTFMTKYWGIAASTNRYFFEKWATFYRNNGDVYLNSSNALLSVGSLDAYCITNQGSNVVWYIKGADNEPSKWTFYAMNNLQTNGSIVVDAAAPPSGDCTNEVNGQTNEIASYLNYDTIEYFATKFTNTQSGKLLCSVTFNVQSNAPSSGRTRIYIAPNHSTQVPGAGQVVSTDSIWATNIVNGWNTVSFTNSAALTQNEPYWLIMQKTPDGSGAGYYRWKVASSSGGSTVYFSGSSWVSQGVMIMTFLLKSSN